MVVGCLRGLVSLVNVNGSPTHYFHSNRPVVFAAALTRTDSAVCLCDIRIVLVFARFARHANHLFLEPESREAPPQHRFAARLACPLKAGSKGIRTHDLLMSFNP